MIKHRLAFLDTETTGLDFDKNEIIEIGCVLVDQDWSGELPVFTVVDEFEIKIKPERIEDADPVSLRINKYDPSDWVFAYTQEEGMKILANKTKGCIMVAHNLCFDASFIDRAFKKTQVLNEMHYLRLDTITMAFAKLHDNREVEKYSLRSLCEYFNIQNKNAHTALADARALYELFTKLIFLNK